MWSTWIKLFTTRIYYGLVHTSTDGYQEEKNLFYCITEIFNIGVGNARKWNMKAWDLGVNNLCTLGAYHTPTQPKKSKWYFIPRCIYTHR